ncbi:hypothetical protein A2803_04605 [Candidatus Woesebacteria bacterium RIFCSPHIGHO2_01_FULL_44_21]|uniref:Uncharacterized protein n=1 Tax=Candidatus Woesebacteria bacterium RIFCSPHIGHO2_01_FULL_44_21 TaxID=1802503 RepID=A0A1F7YWF9_9BACT|nr:MAG: hypothetical protein A2803_04605 [Candidatus Woesebacteria bacterium RIFCSPHIGHO2_01_FULL_44_21]OGM71352.1 MAG: hypothetical protein A2897_00970 [Candidatus Woesebacteria bacterium RIFCSPLOWO2_01_FULL_44_24b]
MKNNRGFAHVLLILAAIAAIVVLVVVVTMQNGAVYPSPAPSAAEDSLLSPSPISDSTDVGTLEAELEATVTGDFEADIDSMETEASSL